MRIEQIKLYHVNNTFKQPFNSAKLELSKRPVLLIQVTHSAGESWGECSALPAGYVGQTLDEAQALLIDRLPTLIGQEVVSESVENVLTLLDFGPAHNYARAAAEMALLDSCLQEENISLASWLGGTKTEIPAGRVCGEVGSADQDHETLVTTVQVALDAGYQKIKLKVSPGSDSQTIARVIELAGQVSVSVDANGTLSPGSDLLLEIDALGLSEIEQPLLAEDLQGSATLADELTTPICLDESVLSGEDLNKILEINAAQRVSIKAPRVGGLMRAKSMAAQAAQAGLGVQVGGMLETGIGRAAAIALASLEEFNLVGDLAASDCYFEEELCTPFESSDGFLQVPSDPGLGIRVDTEAVLRISEPNWIFE